MFNFDFDELLHSPGQARAKLAALAERAIMAECAGIVAYHMAQGALAEARGMADSAMDAATRHAAERDKLANEVESLRLAIIDTRAARDKLSQGDYSPDALRAYRQQWDVLSDELRGMEHARENAGAWRHVASSNLHDDETSLRKARALIADLERIDVPELEVLPLVAAALT